MTCGCSGCCVGCDARESRRFRELINGAQFCVRGGEPSDAVRVERGTEVSAGDLDRRPPQWPRGELGSALAVQFGVQVERLVAGEKGRGGWVETAVGGLSCRCRRMVCPKANNTRAWRRLAALIHSCTGARVLLVAQGVPRHHVPDVVPVVVLQREPALVAEDPLTLLAEADERLAGLGLGRSGR